MMYYPLTTTQRYFYEYQKKAPDSTMYNMYPLLVRLHDWVDLHRLADCIPAVNEAHPAVCSLIEAHNGVPMQRHVPGLIPRPRIERVSDAEFMTLKDTLIQPFYSGEPMFRFRIFQTDTAKYLFIGTYYLVCDAMSKCVWSRDLDKVYSGQKLECDSWLAYLQEMEAMKSSPHYAECRSYYEEKYTPENFTRYPKPDFDSDGVTQGLLFVPSGISEDDLNVLKKAYLTHNEFFVIVSMLSTAAFNQNPRVMHTWTYHDRNRKELHSVIGLTFQDIPVAVDFEGMTTRQVFASIREQFKGGLHNMDYPYTLLNEQCIDDDFLCVTYQGDLYKTSDEISLFDGLVDMAWENCACQNIFDAEMRETDGRIELLLDYEAERYRPENIKTYSDIFVRTVHRILADIKHDNLDANSYAVRFRDSWPRSR